MKLGERSFSTRLSLHILLIVSILFVVSLLVVSITSKWLITDEATKSASKTLNATISQLNGDLKTVEAATNAAVWLVKERQDDTAYLYHITRKLVEESPVIVGSAIAFQENYFKDIQLFSPYSTMDKNSGEVTTFQLADTNYNYLEMEWFSKPQTTGTPTWSEPYFDEGGGNQLMSTYSVPLLNSEGKVYAVLTADVSLEWISKLISDIKPYKHSYVTLVSREGRYIGVEDFDAVEDQTLMSTANATRNQEIIEMTESIMRGEKGLKTYRHKGEKSMALYGSLDNGWHLSMVSQYRDVLSLYSDMQKVLILVSIFGLIAMFIVCRKTVRRLTQPITELSVSAMTMAKGNFHAKLVEIDSNDEMRKLRDSFAYMQESICNYIEELRTTSTANERMEGELNIARKIQQGMLPMNFPANLYAYLNPAKEIGGDLYDFREWKNRLYFAIGDVAGKGVPAALFMAITRAAFHFLTNKELPIGNIVLQINNSFSEGNTSGMFCTLFAGCYDYETGVLHYCNAGHNPIIVIPPSSEPYFLKAKSNLALGLIEDFAYQEEELKIEPGTRLLLYTDGVSEAETADKELFGDERLLQTVTHIAASTHTSQELVEGLYNTVKAFTQDNEQNDDITLMAITIDCRSTIETNAQ